MSGEVVAWVAVVVATVLFVVTDIVMGNRHRKRIAEIDRRIVRNKVLTGYYRGINVILGHFDGVPPLDVLEAAARAAASAAEHIDEICGGDA